jgi:deazaflavin-dependent oxidoreductase (nitroreductase family)
MWFTGWVRRMGRRKWFAALGRAYVPVDRAIGRLTRGRVVALGLPDLPSLLLTCTGRQSGKARSSPLLYAPDGDAYVVIGSNWGQAHHPAWSANLLADPAATVTVNGNTVPVRARLVAGDERARLRELLLAVWPAYTTYEDRSGGRHPRIFRLEPSPGTPAAVRDPASATATRPEPVIPHQSTSTATASPPPAP